MSELESLPPDQRAVLSLVLAQDKTYGEVAAMLGMPEQTVRERAHAALDALASQPGAVIAPGGASNGHHAQTAMASAALADEPSPGGAPTGGTPLRQGPPGGAPLRERPAGGTPLARLGASLPGGGRQGSRLAGALLLVLIAAVVAVAAILISDAGGGKGSGQPASVSGGSSTGGGGSSTSSRGSGSASAPKLNKTLALASVDPSVKAVAVTYVFSQKSQRAFYLAAQGLPSAPAGSFYAVWLYDSPSSAAPLGRLPATGSNGRTEGGGPLPSNAGAFHKIVVTRETSVHATQPGPIVLSGAFALR